MKIKKNVNDDELEKVSGGETGEVIYDVKGEPYEIICPHCFHIFATGDLKPNVPANIDLSDRYCPGCERTVTPILNRLYL